MYTYIIYIYYTLWCIKNIYVFRMIGKHMEHNGKAT